MESLWMILIDISGSMGEAFSGKVRFEGLTDTTTQAIKIDAAKEALVKAVRGLTRSDVAIVAFNDEPKIIFHGSGSDPYIYRRIEDLRAGGGTDIAKAIEYANHHSTRQRQYQLINFLLITDGLADELSAIQAAREAFANNIRTSTILIDPSPEGERLAREISLGGEVRAVTSAFGLDQAVQQARPEPLPAMAVPHQRAAILLHILIVVIFGILALGCVGGGIYAIVVNSISKTEINIFGAQISTGHVGVAFVGIGLLLTFFTIRSVLKNQYDLAALPLDSPRKISRKKR